MKMDDYRFHIYVDYKGDGTWELAAWYDDEKSVNKELAFLRRKGHKAKVVRQF